jgi:hypothetical protein
MWRRIKFVPDLQWSPWSNRTFSRWSWPAWCGWLVRIVLAAFEISFRNCQVGSWARQGGGQFSILGRAENNEIVKIKVSVRRVVINIQGDL